MQLCGMDIEQASYIVVKHQQTAMLKHKVVEYNHHSAR